MRELFELKIVHDFIILNMYYMQDLSLEINNMLSGFPLEA